MCALFRNILPAKSGFKQYRCPVQNCNSEFRGDEISRHFTKNANLALLREALENQLCVI